MAIKALLFDLDGLLLDTEKIYFHCWIEAAKELGYELDKSTALQLRSCDSLLAKKIVEEHCNDSDAYDCIRAKRKAIMADYTKNHPIEVKKGVKEFFQADEIAGFSKYIVTSAIPGDKLMVLQDAGVLAKIDKVITTKQVSRGKPYPDVYLFAMQEAGVTKNECIAFEDSPNGVISASSAGCKVIMIPDLSQPSEDLRAKCDCVIPSLDEVLSILRNNESPFSNFSV